MAQPAHPTKAQAISQLRAPLRSSKPGTTIPRLGLGTWQAASEHVEEAVLVALQSGIRHVDTASEYGVERQVGNAIKRAMETMGLQRDDLHVTTKARVTRRRICCRPRAHLRCLQLWNADHSRVEEACRKSLSELGLEFIDLYIMHWPIAGNKGPTVEPPLEQTWRDMERLVDLGLVRAIGVSNFSVAKLRGLLPHATKPISVLQVESHPYWRNDELADFCAANDIHFSAYSALVRCLHETACTHRCSHAGVAQGSRHSAGHPAAHEEKEELVDDARVKDIASRIGKTVHQVCLRWALQRRQNTSAIFKSTSAEHIKTDSDVAAWSLVDDDMQILNTLPVQRRMLLGSVFLNKEGPYRTLKELWDEQVGE